MNVSLYLRTSNNLVQTSPNALYTFVALTHSETLSIEPYTAISMSIYISSLMYTMPVATVAKGG